MGMVPIVPSLLTKPVKVFTQHVPTFKQSFLLFITVFRRCQGLLPLLPGFQQLPLLFFKIHGHVREIVTNALQPCINLFRTRFQAADLGRQGGEFPISIRQPALGLVPGGFRPF